MGEVSRDRFTSLLLDYAPAELATVPGHVAMAVLQHVAFPHEVALLFIFAHCIGDLEGILWEGMEASQLDGCAARRRRRCFTAISFIGRGIVVELGGGLLPGLHPAEVTRRHRGFVEREEPIEFAVLRRRLGRSIAFPVVPLSDDQQPGFRHLPGLLHILL